MTSPILSHNTNKSGLCPHGLPPSACPVCSKMGGGMKRKDKPQAPVKNNGEWSYMRCYVEGLRLRALKLQKETREQRFQRQIDFINKFSFKISEFINKIMAKIDNLPPVLNFTLSIVIKPVLNLVLLFLPKNFENIFKFFAQVQEKLSSLLGEIKNFLKRKSEEKLKKKLKDAFLDFIENVEQKRTTECENDKNQQN